MTVKQVFNTSAELDYPTVLPTLDLDFANSKTLDPRIDFTRASGGSYLDQNGIIKYAGINEPRFDHDPETGESLGLLIEEQRTNLLAWSQNFNQWTKYRDSAEPSTITVTESDELAPDGISKFFLCTYGVTDLRRAFSGGAGKTYTASCFYKIPNQPNASNVAAFEVHITGGTTSIVQITYNFSENRITRFQGNVPGSFGFKKYPNGVVRLWLTITDNGTGNSVFFLNLRGIQTNQSILTWGAQIEEGTFPTSYIPTQSSARTRAADDASITGKNFSDFYNQQEGTFITTSRWFTKRPSTAINYIFRAFNSLSSENNTIGIWNFGGNDNFILYVFVDDVLQSNLPITEAEAKTTLIDMNTKGLAYKFNDIAFSVNGKLKTVNNIIIPQGLNILYVSQGGAKSQHIKMLKYYPKRLPNSQLQSLTL